MFQLTKNPIVKNTNIGLSTALALCFLKYAKKNAQHQCLASHLPRWAVMLVPTIATLQVISPINFRLREFWITHTHTRIASWCPQSEHKLKHAKMWKPKQRSPMSPTWVMVESSWPADSSVLVEDVQGRRRWPISKWSVSVSLWSSWVPRMSMRYQVGKWASMTYPFVCTWQSIKHSCHCYGWSGP